MSDTSKNYTWFRNNSETAWVTPHAHRDYTGDIVYVAGTGYTLTITGSGAPAPTAYPTLRNAKNAFRVFLTTKPVVV